MYMYYIDNIVTILYFHPQKKFQYIIYTKYVIITIRMSSTLLSPSKSETICLYHRFFFILDQTAKSKGMVLHKTSTPNNNLKCGTFPDSNRFTGSLRRHIKFMLKAVVYYFKENRLTLYKKKISKGRAQEVPSLELPLSYWLMCYSPRSISDRVLSTRKCHSHFHVKSFLLCFIIKQNSFTAWPCGWSWTHWWDMKYLNLIDFFSLIYFFS